MKPTKLERAMLDELRMAEKIISNAYCLMRGDMFATWVYRNERDGCYPEGGGTPARLAAIGSLIALAERTFAQEEVEP
jgi:hypothetical protein